MSQGAPDRSQVILDALRSGPATIAQLVERTHIPIASVYRVTGALERAGKVSRRDGVVSLHGDNRRDNQRDNRADNQRDYHDNQVVVSSIKLFTDNNKQQNSEKAVGADNHRDNHGGDNHPDERFSRPYQERHLELACKYGGKAIDYPDRWVKKAIEGGWEIPQDWLAREAADAAKASMKGTLEEQDHQRRAEAHKRRLVEAAWAALDDGELTALREQARASVDLSRVAKVVHRATIDIRVKQMLAQRIG